eukprot:5797466-Heterocapsa_arctica.AAC.1
MDSILGKQILDQRKVTSKSEHLANIGTIISEHLANIGRVPWIIGGDWNLEPGTFTLDNTNAKAAYVEPGSHTYNRDGVTSKLDWFLVCPGLAIPAEAMVNNDTHMSGHSPV